MPENDNKKVDEVKALKAEIVKLKKELADAKVNEKSDAEKKQVTVEDYLKRKAELEKGQK